MKYFHTGKYDITTDRFVGGEYATVVTTAKHPFGLMVAAPTVAELEQKVRDVR